MQAGTRTQHLFMKNIGLTDSCFSLMKNGADNQVSGVMLNASGKDRIALNSIFQEKYWIIQNQSENASVM